MPVGVFSTVAHRIAALQGEVFPLHIGDTWLEPPPGGRLSDLAQDEAAGLHRYGPPRGQPELVRAIAARRDVDPRQVRVTNGATGGLSSAMGALLQPGDQVMLLGPYWPLIRGIVATRGGVPVDVPFFATPPGAAPLPDSVEQRLLPFLSPRTVALYLNSPNNPSGVVLTGQEVEDVAAFARRHDLWVFADEVYEDYAFARPHEPVARAAPERTLSAYSFSKAYGLAGHRVGYLVGPDAAVVDEVHKVAMHTSYSAPVALQRAACRVLERGADWVANARARYREAGEAAAAALSMPAPQGGTFLLVDVTSHLDDRGMQGFLEDCIDRHLLVAPGGSCGAHYAGCIRLCFTSAPPEQVARGVGVLAELLGC